MSFLKNMVRSWLGVVEHPAVVRALVAIAWQEAAKRRGLRVVYGLGKGGKNPLAEHPFEEIEPGVWACDCSGFDCWCHLVNRQDPASGAWRYTDSFERDARGLIRGDIGDGVLWHDGRPGDIVSRGAGPKTGHCGIGMKAGKAGITAVAHCQASKPGPIIITPPTYWTKHDDTVVLRVRPSSV